MSVLKNEVRIERKKEKSVFGSAYEAFEKNGFSLRLYDYKNKDELFNAIDQLVKDFKAGYQEVETK